MFPKPHPFAALKALIALIHHKQLMAPLEVFQDELGNAFQLELPDFKAIMLAGPDANHFVLVEARDRFRWCNAGDPVAHLLRHGILVEDGESHDTLRREMAPSLHRSMIRNYVEAMWRCTDTVTNDWRDATHLDLRVETRRIALLILMETLFGVDFDPDMQALWQPILKAIGYISPGAWMLWRGVPRPGYRRDLKQLDDYLHQLITARRLSTTLREDLLGVLVAAGRSDDEIRDQLFTMLIAGHDTSTALLSWTFYLLTTHSDIMIRVRDEIDRVLESNPPTLELIDQLVYTEQVIKEVLRLYPPIHLGSRLAASNINYQGRVIPAGTRVLYSIYLTHRDKRYWSDPDRFDPDRFSPENARKHSPYQFLPFGGGPRNCIGAAFAQVEAKVVLARILQKYDLRFVGGIVRPHMGATLEPHPGVRVEVRKRTP